MNSVTIFTDGASRGNPGPGGWGAILIFDDHDRKMIKELGGGETKATNNQMEIKAASEALKRLEALKLHSANINIYTDSSYLINGISKWVEGWDKNDWQTKAKKEVLNKKLWKELQHLVARKNIEWKYVGGHRGTVGNERCDEIATAFADRRDVELFEGEAKDYFADIMNISQDLGKSEKRTKDRSRSKAKAYSYVSMVDGKVKTHVTWEECEKRVKGKSGAKFKKALSAADEKLIANEWKLAQRRDNI